MADLPGLISVYYVDCFPRQWNEKLSKEEMDFVSHSKGEGTTNEENLFPGLELFLDSKDYSGSLMERRRWQNIALYRTIDDKLLYRCCVRGQAGCGGGLGVEGRFRGSGIIVLAEPSVSIECHLFQECGKIDLI